MGSAQSARRIQLGGSGSAVPVCGDLLVGPRPGRARPPPGAFPPSAVRRDRLWVGLEGLGAKVARASASSFTAPLSAPRRFPGPRNECSLRHLPSGGDGAPRPRRDVNRVGLSSVRTRTRRVARAGIGSRKLAPGVSGDVGNPPDPS